MRVSLDLEKRTHRTPHGSHICRLYTQMLVQLCVAANPAPFRVTQVLVDTGSPYTIIPIMHWDPPPYDTGVDVGLEKLAVPIGGENRDCVVAKASISFFDNSDNKSPQIVGNVLLAYDENFNMPILGMDFLESARLVCNPAPETENYLEFEDSMM